MPKGSSGRTAAAPAARTVSEFSDIRIGLQEAFVSGLGEAGPDSFYAQYSESDIEASVRYWRGGQTERIYVDIGTGGTRGSAAIWMDTRGRIEEQGKRSGGVAMDAAFRSAKDWMLKNSENIFSIMRERSARR